MPYTFPDVASLKGAARIPIGSTVETEGYYAPGDGGHARYVIEAPHAYPIYDPTAAYGVGAIVVHNSLHSMSDVESGVTLNVPQLFRATTAVTPPGAGGRLREERDGGPWRFLGGGQIPGDGSHVWLADGKVARYVLQGELNVLQLGARGDVPDAPGDWDDYAPLRLVSRYVSSIRGGCRVVFPRRVFSIRTQNSAHPQGAGYALHPITLEDVAGVELAGHGCEIRMMGGYPLSQSPFRYPFSGIRLINCARVSISGFRLDGGAATLAPLGAGVAFDSSGLDMRGAYDCSFADIEIRDFILDGVALSGYSGSNTINNGSDATRYVNSRRLHFRNVRALGCARQGMSITGAEHARFDQCEFSDTGTSAYGSHAHGVGVDIEADRFPGDGGVSPLPPLDSGGHIVFVDCVMRNNAGGSFWSGLQRHHDITLERCILESAGRPEAQTYDVQLSSPNTFVRQCLIRSDSVVGILSTIPEADPGSRIVVEDCRIELRSPGADRAYILPLGRGIVFQRNSVLSWDRLSLINAGCTDSVFRDNRFWKSQEAFEPANPYPPFLTAQTVADTTRWINNTYDTDLPPQPGRHPFMVFTLDNNPCTAFEGERLITPAVEFAAIQGSWEAPGFHHPRATVDAHVAAGRIGFGDVVLAAAASPPASGLFGRGSIVLNTHFAGAGSGTPAWWFAPNAGWACNAAYDPARAYAVGERAFVGANVYQVFQAGTPSGTTPPSGAAHHVPIADGGVVWQYIGARVVFQAFMP